MSAISARRAAGKYHTYDEVEALLRGWAASHPALAALFQQALQGEARSVGARLVRRWLDRLFGQGLETISGLGLDGLEREDLALHVIMMFNVTTGYVLSQRALEAMGGGRVDDPKVLERQKKLLARIAMASLSASKP